ncbi:hypothetical protein AMTRI_Chr04g181290 [Amborella trichopoda]
MGTRLELSLLSFSIFILCNSQGSISISLYPQGFNITTMARPPLPHYPETHTLLSPILTNLGYTELAMAVPYLYDSYLSSWAGPATLFAIDDQAIRSCSRCSRPQTLIEHIIPGLFTYSDRCITVTSMNSTENTTKVLIDGVQITHPDLFNDALLVIHGLDGFVFPLSPQSYAMLRLRSSGFSIVGLALRIKYGELVGLQNMTIFALDDRSILNGGYAYVHNVRFHIVPDRYLKGSDLAQLHVGSILQTLVRGQDLVVTNPGSVRGSLRINFVPLKGCDVMYDSRILVHSIFVPFPRFGDGLFHETGSVLEKDGLLPEKKILSPGNSASCNPVSRPSIFKIFISL